MSSALDRWLDHDAPAVALPCHGRTWLYFSIDSASQQAAVRLCRGCPVLVRCRARCDALEADTWASPAGIWAGETPAERARRRGA